MRDRAVVTRVALAVPPPQLRMFGDPSAPGGRGPGMDAFADRAAWLAARREWAAGHGLTVLEWWDELLAESLADGCSLDELNMAFSRYMTEPDDWSDPRLQRPENAGMVP